MLYSRLIGKSIRHHPGSYMLEGHSLLVQGGYIRVLGQGLVSFLPMGMRVVGKLRSLIAGEMQALGGEEFQVPMVNPLSIWEKSGRSNMQDNPLITFRDGQGRQLVLAPTHEEASLELAKSVVNSYRDFPLFLYQFQSKFRDEQKTRAGLIRTKEFVMKDAYSFHRSFADLNNFFPRVFNAYLRIFEQCGIPVVPAESGVGIMGGSRAYEFLFPHDQGRDIVMICPRCGYRANRTVALGVKISGSEILKGMEKVKTVICPDLDCQADTLGIPKRRLIKPRVYITDQGPVMAVVRGDYDVSLDKLTALLGTSVSKPADDRTLRYYNLLPGYMSPVPPPEGVRIIVDEGVVSTPNLAMGTNQQDYFYLNVNFGRDFDIPETGDIAQLNDGDLCLACSTPLESVHAFELGNIFKLDDFYTRKMEFSFRDDRGQVRFPYMGAYGLGLGRLLACMAEANRDERGLIWPVELAPYTYYIMGIGRSAKVSAYVDEIAAELGHDDVLVDDRIGSIGMKFKDADLLGIPLRIVVSRRFLSDGEVELQDRKTREHWYVKKEDLMKELKQWREQHAG